MRLITCHIYNFGTLSNYDMSFEEGLNVIMQDNGWGKSTLAAFLKAMLYGYDNSRKKDLSENDRKHYKPWQGGKYGGSLTFEKNGTRYMVTRTFGDTARSDTVSLRDLDRGRNLMNIANVGEWLFGLDADAFKRSTFINSNQLNSNSSGLSFHARLNAVLGEANDVEAFDSALEQIVKRTKDYEKTGNRGYIAEIQKKIDELLEQQRKAKESIARVDEMRQKICEINGNIAQVDGEIALLKKKVNDEDSGKKEREAAHKFYEQLISQRDDLQKELVDLCEEAGGEIPSIQEIRTVKQKQSEIVRINESLAALKDDKEKEIGKIQAQYDELYEKKAMFEKEVEKVSDEFGDYIPTDAEVQDACRNLNDAAQMTEALDGFARKKTELENEIHVIELRYGGQIPTIAELTSIMQTQTVLNDTLHQIQDSVQIKEELENARKEKADIESFFKDEFPNTEMLLQIRQDIVVADTLGNTALGLDAQVNGEQARIVSIESAIDQLEATSTAIEFPETKPKFSVAIGFIVGAGILAILGVVVSSLIFVGAGALAIIGIGIFVSSNSKNAEYERKRQKYAEGKRKAAEKRIELESELAAARKSYKSTAEEAASKRNKAEGLVKGAVSYLQKWNVSATKDNAIQIADELYGKMNALHDADNVITAVGSKMEELNNSAEELNNRLKSEKEMLPSDTMDLSLDARVSAAEEDVEHIKDLNADLKVTIGQLEEQKKKLEQLTDATADFLAKCGLSLDEAEQKLPELKEKLTVLAEARHNLIEHQKRIADFESMNQAALTGKEQADSSVSSAQGNLEKQLEILLSAVKEILGKYQIHDSEVETWIAASENYAILQEDIQQRKLMLEEQINEYEATHKSLLVSEKEINEVTGEKPTPNQIQLSSKEQTRESLKKARIQAEDVISHADETLESYRMIVSQLKLLGEEKQKAQKSLYVLKKSFEYLNAAKENLASRYLGQIEYNFNQYFSALVEREDVLGVVDVDFNITMDDNGNVREAEGYSTGYCDVIDFCMRLALIDTLFEDERPFIIMDDPFVNLDAKRLNHAMQLLKSISSESQIIYFVCHEVRASEPTTENMLEIGHKKLIKSAVRKAKPKKDTKKTRFTLVAENVLTPVSDNRKITNNIFTLAFNVVEGNDGSGEYELFFVDENEKVLCDRQSLSVVDGEAITEKVRFCINTGNAFGRFYYLCIRNVCAAENEIAQKIPYEAAITFTTDFDF